MCKAHCTKCNRATVHRATVQPCNALRAVGLKSNCILDLRVMYFVHRASCFVLCALCIVLNPNPTLLILFICRTGGMAFEPFLWSLIMFKTVYNFSSCSSEQATLQTCRACKGYGEVGMFERRHSCEHCRGYGEAWITAGGWHLPKYARSHTHGRLY